MTEFKQPQKHDFCGLVMLLSTSHRHSPMNISGKSWRQEPDKADSLAGTIFLPEEWDFLFIYFLLNQIKQLQCSLPPKLFITMQYIKIQQISLFFYKTLEVLNFTEVNRLHAQRTSFKLLKTGFLRQMHIG